MKLTLILSILLMAAMCSSASAKERPNIILVFADDISARELPIYDSSVWSPPTGGNTTDAKFRARTPALDQMASEGCWVKTAWASVVCSPSRAMMMTGRYAHLHKWWSNKDKGRYLNAEGKTVTWPLYESSPRLIGHVAQQAGYATYWAGKTQMAGDLREFGFDQGCFTPGELADVDNPYTDFKMYQKKVDGEKRLFNSDTDTQIESYLQHGWYWNPHVRLMKHPGKPNGFQWWPNTPESEAAFGLNTFGPDVELDFVFDFMDRQHADGKPFFVYHTSHLGHDAFDWLNPDSESKWPGTPIVKWDGTGYTRTEPNVTGDKGVYDDHGTLTQPGIHNHVNYLDYQIWRYRNKLQEMGIADNTVLIFCADNGTVGYGKNSSDRQKGTHVPLIIVAPGMTKQGQQDVLVNMSDMLPTIAELSGAELPADYEINGESLVPFLFTEKATHRDWIYGYSGSDQIIRGDLVLKDGKGKWWDVSTDPDDLISFAQITDWNSVSEAHRAERDELMKVLPEFDLHDTEHDAPGVDLPALPVKTPKTKVKPNVKREPKQKKDNAATIDALNDATTSTTPALQPNVLFILTDDQRYDSIRAFNQILHHRDESELGYVESPNVDELARRGTTFINTYCHAQGCAPSRASMHFGRYPHHSGIYEFEYFNNKADHWKPSMPQCMQQLGYQTMHVGKLGVRVRTLADGKPKKFDLYQTELDFKKMFADGLTDWRKGPIADVGGVDVSGEQVEGDFFISPDGIAEVSSADLSRVKSFENHSQQVDAKYDLLRMYNDKKPKAFGEGEIIGGVSPQPAGKTRDGNYTEQLVQYLENPNRSLSAGSQRFKGVDPSKPLFAHIGFDFPHTPVLPPQSFRDRFQHQTYKIPSFDRKELSTLPTQLKKLIAINHSDHYTDAEKQQMVQDYYAFCAYGDSLVGQAADAFVEYSKSQNQPWMLVYVCGDHGWKLNEHGAISKFSPWKVDSLDPIIVVSSDNKRFPAGRVVTDFTEFVDIMPTVLAAGGADLSNAEFEFLDGFDLAKVVSGELPPRDYVIGESHAVTGPRATIRTKDFMFSIKSRPDKNRGRNMEWAMNAKYEELEPVLYRVTTDPDELHNLAFDKAYAQIAETLKNKLLNIVLGDGRVEVDWGPKATGTKAVISNFAPGADNKQLKL